MFGKDNKTAPGRVLGASPAQTSGEATARTAIEPGAAPPKFLGRWPFPFYYGWVIVAVCLVGDFMASGMGGLTISLFYRPIHESLGWSLTLFTGAVSASTLAGTAVTPVLGRLLDRLGPRPIMLWGACAAGIGLLCLSQVREVWQFWLLYASVGALGLYEMGNFVSPVVVSKWFIRKRGRAMAVETYGISLAGAIMTSVIGLLLSNVGWRATWAIMGVTLMVVMVPLVFLFMRRQPEDVGLLPDGDLPQAAMEATGKARPAPVAEVNWTPKEAFRSRTLWVLVASMNLMSCCASVQAFHGVTFLTQQLGMTVAAAGAITTVRWVGVSICRVPWGFIVERAPIRYCLAGAYLVKASSLLWLIILPSPMNIVLYLVTFSMGGVQVLVQPMAFANYYGRKSQGTIQGILRPLMAIPSLIGPLLVAILFDHVGSFNLAFLIASGLGMAAGLLALWATPPVRKVAAT